MRYVMLLVMCWWYPYAVLAQQISPQERLLFSTVEELEPLGIVYENAAAGEELEKENYDDGSALYTYEFSDSDLWLHELVWVEASAQAANFTFDAYGEASKTYLSEGLRLSPFRLVYVENSNAIVVVADVLNSNSTKVGHIIRYKERNVSGMLILMGIEFENENVLTKFISNEFRRKSQTCTKLSLWK